MAEVSENRRGDSEPEKYGQISVPYVYEGMVLSDQVPCYVVDQVKTLCLDDKVIITSYPKTGTTWLQQIVWLIQHDGCTEESDVTPVYERVPFLEFRAPGVPIDLVLSLEPATFKSHLPLRFFKKQLESGRTKFVISVRNPKDTLVSFFHFYQALANLSFNGSWDDFFELYKRKHLAYGDIFDWYVDLLEFNQLYETQILIVKYEDLKRQPTEEIKKIVKFLGKDFDDTVIEGIRKNTTFQSMKANPMTNYSTFPYSRNNLSPFLRKGEVGEWQQYFSPEQSELLDSAYQERLFSRGFHLDFN